MKVPSMIETKVTRSLKGSVLYLIQKDYQFIACEKIQDMFATDVVDLVNKWKGSIHRLHFFKCSIGSTHRLQL